MLTGQSIFGAVVITQGGGYWQVKPSTVQPFLDLEHIEISYDLFK